jgi:hypothetical protein
MTAVEKAVDLAWLKAMKIADGALLTTCALSRLKIVQLSQLSPLRLALRSLACSQNLAAHLVERL